MINGGSPVGPGFVVYERGEGKNGYDLELAKLSVGPGWHPLLAAFWKYLDQRNEGSPDPIVVVQVKEKYGGLRIYLSHGDNYEVGMTSGIRLASTTICEDCGEPGELRNDIVWIRTLCSAHYLEARS